MTGLPVACVISLDPEGDRFGATAAALATAGFQVAHLPASDGRGRPAVAWHRRWRFGRALTQAEAGCFESHRAAAAAFLQTTATIGLVVEDDARPVPQAAQRLRAVIAALPPEGWDIVNLGAPARILFTPLAHGLPGAGLRRAHFAPLTTHAILWSRAGAARFLAQSAGSAMPVDHFLRVWQARADRALALDAPLFRATDGASEIDARGHRDTVTAGWWYRRARARRRRIAKVRAWLHRWRARLQNHVAKG